MNEDAVIACADLVGRTGASGFEIGFLHEDVPVEDAGWYAVAFYRGARITTDERRNPSEAAMALSERLLRDAACRCGRRVALSGSQPGRCRWRLMGATWEPGCDAVADYRRTPWRRCGDGQGHAREDRREPCRAAARAAGPVASSRGR
jgi:hypothetical protein